MLVYDIYQGRNITPITKDLFTEKIFTCRNRLPACCKQPAFLKASALRFIIITKQ